MNIKISPGFGKHNNVSSKEQEWGDVLTPLHGFSPGSPVSFYCQEPRRMGLIVHSTKGVNVSVNYFPPQNLLLGGPSPKGQINSTRLTSKKPPDLLQRTGRITGHTSRTLSVYSEWEQFVGLWWVLLGQFRHVLLFYCTVVRVIGVKTGLGQSEDWQHKGQGCVPGFLK